jgi:hypothetical protein
LPPVEADSGSDLTDDETVDVVLDVSVGNRWT